MRRDFYLENGIYCKGTFNDFKLYYDTIELTPNCNNIAYIPNTLIAVKSKKTVYVYRPKISYINNLPMLYELARFESITSNAYLKVRLSSDKVYIIDCNVQVTLCSCKRFS